MTKHPIVFLLTRMGLIKFINNSQKYNMIETSNSHYPYEHYGDLAVDFGSSYWETLTSKHIDTSKWKPTGFNFHVNNEGHFSFYIWAIPINSTPNDKGEIPIKKIKTDMTWEEFSNSFVSLNAQLFWGRQGVDKFYELNDNE
jgi:hypothetical protein